MSEMQKGRPTIYGEGQPPRRRTSRPGMSPTGAERQRNHAAGVQRRMGYGEPVARPGRRMPERLDDVQMENADRAGTEHRVRTENRVRTEQAPRRYVPGAGYQGAVRDREELPEETRRMDFASDRKLRALWSVFGILAVLLVAAIIYEVVLGNGLKETGNQRMAGQNGTQTTSQTNAQTTAQTNAAASTPAADAASTPQTTAQTSAAATPDAGTTDAATGSDSAAADDSADGAADHSGGDTADDIPTIPLEGDDAQADAASGAEG